MQLQTFLFDYCKYITCVPSFHIDIKKYFFVKHPALEGKITKAGPGPVPPPPS